MDNELTQLKDEVRKLRQDLKELNDEVYNSNFTSSQIFNKNIICNSVLKIPHYATAPTKADVGEIIEIAGVAYICSSANTFTKIGLQT